MISYISFIFVQYLYIYIYVFKNSCLGGLASGCFTDIAQTV